MVGVSVDAYAGRGFAGRENAVRGNDDRGKDVVPRGASSIRETKS